MNEEHKNWLEQRGIQSDLAARLGITGTTKAGKSWLSIPYRLDGQRLPIRRAPPTLGEGTRAVLQELLAMSDSQLEALQTSGVLTLPKN